MGISCFTFKTCLVFCVHLFQKHALSSTSPEACLALLLFGSGWCRSKSVPFTAFSSIRFRTLKAPRAGPSTTWPAVSMFGQDFAPVRWLPWWYFTYPLLQMGSLITTPQIRSGLQGQGVKDSSIGEKLDWDSEDEITGR